MDPGPSDALVAADDVDGADTDRVGIDEYIEQERLKGTGLLVGPIKLFLHSSSFEEDYTVLTQCVTSFNEYTIMVRDADPARKLELLFLFAQAYEADTGLCGHLLGMFADVVEDYFGTVTESQWETFNKSLDNVLAQEFQGHKFSILADPEYHFSDRDAAKGRERRQILDEEESRTRLQQQICRTLEDLGNSSFFELRRSKLGFGINQGAKRKEPFILWWYTQVLLTSARRGHFKFLGRANLLKYRRSGSKFLYWACVGYRLQRMSSLDIIDSSAFWVSSSIAEKFDCFSAVVMPEFESKLVTLQGVKQADLRRVHDFRHRLIASLMSIALLGTKLFADLFKRWSEQSGMIHELERSLPNFSRAFPQ